MTAPDLYKVPETAREKFRLGQRVKPSERGLAMFARRMAPERAATKGVVVGFGGRQLVERKNRKVRTVSPGKERIVYVKRDGVPSRQAFPMDWWQAV